LAVLSLWLYGRRHKTSAWLRGAARPEARRRDERREAKRPGISHAAILPILNIYFNPLEAEITIKFSQLIVDSEK